MKRLRRHSCSASKKNTTPFHVFLCSSAAFSLFGLTRMMATKSSMNRIGRLTDSADHAKKPFQLSRLVSSLASKSPWWLLVEFWFSRTGTTTDHKVNIKKIPTLQSVHSYSVHVLQKLFPKHKEEQIAADLCHRLE